VTFEEYLADKNPDAVALFGRFQELVEACGPSEATPRRTIVHWKRKRSSPVRSWRAAGWR